MIFLGILLIVTRPGGRLGSHLDHSYVGTDLIHVANTIFYASSEWQIDWGGETVFYSSHGFKACEFVQPIPNRLVVFIHTSESFFTVFFLIAVPILHNEKYFITIIIFLNLLLTTLRTHILINYDRNPCFLGMAPLFAENVINAFFEDSFFVSLKN